MKQNKIYKVKFFLFKIFYSSLIVLKKKKKRFRSSDFDAIYRGEIDIKKKKKRSINIDATSWI